MATFGMRMTWAALLAALLAAPAGTTLAAAVEDLLAAEVEAMLGPAALPGEARVSVRLAVPFAGPAEAVRHLTFDASSGQLRALVAGDGRIHELAGTATVEIDVPVPARRVRPGEILSQGDLTTVSMPLDRLPASAVASLDGLIGMAARRQLSPGRLIHTSSIGAPVVVDRNEPVTLVFQQGGLYLAAQARALQDGGVGDRVRVMNPSSNAVVSGTVTAPGTVSVSP
ncbi:flagellar basal body P-ring formation chaperone FlgA [Arenibaculum sp.]|jgi:flagella basal body P-ring formation protein FlgA|uniref:flagellar basal body P-ring formation chaperone FlgA n=1 Tax=Arenibaculum sp. TaxID=2865862 RepID=UPI002E116AD2|nr:flagellar basal body P-ring formation chaperone FlgA [Arenibaculum sp.]